MNEVSGDEDPAPEEIGKSSISIQLLILSAMALLIRSPPLLSSAFVILKCLYWTGLGCLYVIEKRDGWSLFMGKCLSKTALPLWFNWMLQIVQQSSDQAKDVFDWKDYQLLCKKGLSNLESLDQIFGWSMLISFGIANQTRFEYLMLGIVLVIMDTQTFMSLPFIKRIERNELDAHLASFSFVGLLGLASISQDWRIACMAILSCLMLIWSKREAHELCTHRSSDVHYPELFTGFAVTLILFAHLMLLSFWVGPVHSSTEIQAIFWRVVHSFGLGLLLYYQAHYRTGTKVFVRHGLSARVALTHWLMIYSFSLTMTHVSFAIASVRLYSVPESYLYVGTLFKHGFGLVLILLYIQSIDQEYRRKGITGFLYHHFFIVQDAQSVFLPQFHLLLPLWGMAIICDSSMIYTLAVISQLLHAAFTLLVDIPYRNTLNELSLVESVSATRQDSNETCDTLCEYTDGEEDSDINSDVSLDFGHGLGIMEKIKTAAKELESLVGSAKPKVAKMVQKTKVEVARIGRQGFGESEKDTLRTDLYSLSFPDRSQSAPLIFQLGEPIVLEFVAVRETIKANDWIGIYGVTHNIDKAITTSQCGDQWTFVTGPNAPGWTPASDDATMSIPAAAKSIFGTTPVEMRQCPGESGLRLVKGRLKFRDKLLPWKVGVYEARYHFNGKYACITISRPFEIVALNCEGDPVSGLNTPLFEKDTTTEQILCKIMERCFDIDSDASFSPRMDVFDQARQIKHFSLDRNEEMCRRIVYLIKQSFGVDFSWKILRSVRTIEKLSKKIQEARVSLACYELQDDDHAPNANR